MSEEENAKNWDSYFIEGTEVLNNKLGITNKEELQKKEIDITFSKLVDLQENPIEGNYDKEHFKSIHKYLFEDIYPFAGEYRNCSMTRFRTIFVEPYQIDKYLDETFAIANTKMEEVTDKRSFVELIAKLYADLIHAHPFREGNGRTTREFIREYVLEKSKNKSFGPLELDFSLVDRENLNTYVEIAHIFPYKIVEEFDKATNRVDTKTK